MSASPAGAPRWPPPGSSGATATRRRGAACTPARGGCGRAVWRLAAMRTTNVVVLGLIIGVVAWWSRPGAPTPRGPGRSALRAGWPWPWWCSAWSSRSSSATACPGHHAVHPAVGGAAVVDGRGEHRRPGHGGGAGGRVPARAAAGPVLDLLRRREQPVQPVPHAEGAARRALRGGRRRHGGARVRPAGGDRGGRVRQARTAPGSARPRRAPPSAAWPSRCSRARSTGRSRWPRPWTRGATAAGPSRAARPARRDRRHPDRAAGGGRRARTAWSTPARRRGSACRCSARGRSSWPPACSPRPARPPRTRYRPDPWRLPEWVVAHRRWPLPAATVVIALGRGGAASTPRRRP